MFPKATKTLLLNLLAFALLPHGVAAGQKPAASPQSPSTAKTLPYDTVDKGPTGPPFVLTELQQARLDAARQEIYRWQDKLQDALQKFSAICKEAQKENQWPAVQCSLTDLTVTPMPVAAPVLKPADK